MSGPRILVIGAAGQLGRELQRSFAGYGELICRNRENLDVANEQQVRNVVRDTRPDLILNAAAYTAVDRAESEPKLAMAVNAAAPRVMAEEASRRDILFVHYSTDYVFDGSKHAAWTESDTPNPLNTYGKTKLAGEGAIQQVGGRYLILRTSWVYGPHGHNFLLTMLRLGRERNTLEVVDDQVGGPTTSIELADATRSISDAVLTGRCGAPQQWSGVYHVTCGGRTSWYGFAQTLFARAQGLLRYVPPRVLPISTADYPTPAARPKNSVLSNAKLHDRFGVRLNEWQDALDQVFENLRNLAGVQKSASL